MRPSERVPASVPRTEICLCVSQREQKRTKDRGVCVCERERDRDRDRERERHTERGGGREDGETSTQNPFLSLSHRPTEEGWQ
jgi:hypothetical protein